MFVVHNTVVTKTMLNTVVEDQGIVNQLVLILVNIYLTYGRPTRLSPRFQACRACASKVDGFGGSRQAKTTPMAKATNRRAAAWLWLEYLGAHVDVSQHPERGGLRPFTRLFLGPLVLRSSAEMSSGSKITTDCVRGLPGERRGTMTSSLMATGP